MIKKLQIKHFKALRDITLDLGPVHVLIGPNDSGKTSILEAIAALCRTVDHSLSDAFAGPWEGNSLVWERSPELTVMLKATVEDEVGDFEYEIDVRFLPGKRSAVVWRETFIGANGMNIPDFGFENHAESGVNNLVRRPRKEQQDYLAAAAQVHDALEGIQYYRWIPKLLSLPVAPDSKVRYRMEPSGFGLARCLDDILGFDRKRFDALENSFKTIFPEVKAIRLKPELAYKAPPDAAEQVDILSRADGKGVHFEFANGLPELPAAQVSDGMLLILAYLAVLHLPKPPGVLLLEEPENGIHPKRLFDVLAILRDLIPKQSKTQVILTTHSPYVVDHFKPEQVTLCRKESDGSISIHRLSDSKAVREQLDVFTLGEIWTGEGDDALAAPVDSQESPAP